jgi:hypothetical protein
MDNKMSCRKDECCFIVTAPTVKTAAVSFSFQGTSENMLPVNGVLDAKVIGRAKIKKIAVVMSTVPDDETVEFRLAVLNPGFTITETEISSSNIVLNGGEQTKERDVNIDLTDDIYLAMPIAEASYTNQDALAWITYFYEWK